MRELLKIVGQEFRVVRSEMLPKRHAVPGYYSYRIVYAFKGKLKGPVEIRGSGISDALNRFLVDFIDQNIPEYEDNK